MSRHTARLTTAECVLVEVANALYAVPWRAQAITLIDGLCRLPHLTILPADTSDHHFKQAGFTKLL